jgi:hypothetical protein
MGLGECRIYGRFPVIPGVDHLIILGEASLADHGLKVRATLAGQAPPGAHRHAGR